MQGAGHRVAIVGYGVLGACGVGKDAFWAGLNGPGLQGGIDAKIPNWDPLPWFDSPKEARRADRVEQFALAAAAEAFEQAGSLGVDPTRFGTIFATGIGGLGTLEEQVETRLNKGERRVSPFLVPLRAPGSQRNDLHGMCCIHPRTRICSPINCLGAL
jgi:3-oxoacyl-[acyl-carrier-protein] synthase II